MQRLLIIGFGDIARRVLPLVAGKYRVYALARSTARAQAMRALGVVPVPGDLDCPASLDRLSGLAQHIMHFAPPQNDGGDDLRTKHLVAALAKGRSQPQCLVYISTSGVYGDCGGEPVTETRPIMPATLRAARRADAEARLRAWGRRTGAGVAIVRAPGIYAAERLPLSRLKEGVPALHHEQDSYTNHIHADDLAHIAALALQRGKPGRIYHACDDSHLKMGDYFDLVADSLGLPRPPRISRAEARVGIPAALLSFMTESRRLSNARMKRELRVKLRHPDVAGFLDALGREKTAPATRCASDG